MKPLMFLLIFAAVSLSGLVAQSPADPPLIPTGPAEKGRLERVIEQPGHIEPFAQTPLMVKYPGFVKSVLVDIGDRVKAGQLLAEINMPEADQDLKLKQAAIAQATAEVTQSKKLESVSEANTVAAAAAVVEAKAARGRAQANRDRWKSELARVTSLVERRVIDEQTRDETNNQLRAAEATLEEVESKIKTAEASQLESAARQEKAKADISVAEAKLKLAMADEAKAKVVLEYSRVKAPFDGVVTARHIDVGHFLQPTNRDTPVFVVTQTDPVRVFVDVPEADAAYVMHGESAKIRVPAIRGREFSGNVTRSTWTLDAKARTLRTAIDLANADGVLRPGMYAYASISIAHPACFSLPVSAITRSGETASTFVVRDGKAVKLPVQLGSANSNRVEILKIDSAGKWVDPAGTEIFILKATGISEGQPIALSR